MVVWYNEDRKCLRYERREEVYGKKQFVMKSAKEE